MKLFCTGTLANKKKYFRQQIRFLFPCLGTKVQLAPPMVKCEGKYNGCAKTEIGYGNIIFHYLKFLHENYSNMT